MFFFSDNRSGLRLRFFTVGFGFGSGPGKSSFDLQLCDDSSMSMRNGAGAGNTKGIPKVTLSLSSQLVCGLHPPSLLFGGFTTHDGPEPPRSSWHPGILSTRDTLVKLLKGTWHLASGK